MKFIDYLLEKKADTLSKGGISHLEHIEDLFLIKGNEGLQLYADNLEKFLDLTGFEGDQTFLSVKIDGCVHEDTEILTNKGDIKIKDLVKYELYWNDIKIIGRYLNTDIPYDDAVDLIRAVASPPEKNWVEIVLEDNTSIKLTEDHMLYTTNRGWVEAKDLTEEDDIKEL